MRSLPINPKVTAAPADEGDIDLLQILDTLKRGKWMILFCVTLCFLISGYYAFRVATPLYTTAATIALQSRSEKIVDLASPLSGLGGDFYTINTEVAALSSRGLVEKLVDILFFHESGVSYRLPDFTA